MALTIVMQELVTVSIDAASTARQVTQPEAEWVDLTPYQDLVPLFYTSLGTTTTGTLYLETSPVREDAAFLSFPLTSIAASTAPNGWSLPSGAIFHLTTGSPPFYRWCRWRIVGPTTGSPATWTFRIVLNVNSAPG